MASESLITPLFPLPDLVFYPHTLLPLHIFEPRYVAMTDDALTGPRIISVVQLRPNWEHDYDGTPPVYQVATMGRIVHHERLDSGRFNILLLGLERIRILEELPSEGLAYRRALVDVIRGEDEIGPLERRRRRREREEREAAEAGAASFDPAGAEADGGGDGDNDSNVDDVEDIESIVVEDPTPEQRERRRLIDEGRSRALAQSHRMMELRPVLRRWLEKVLTTYDRPGVFADVLAAFLAQNFAVGAYERQCILEEEDVARRLALVSVQMQRIISELIGGAY
jgi:ATP-dependent Lon protease